MSANLLSPLSDLKELPGHSLAPSFGRGACASGRGAVEGKIEALTITS